MKATEDLKSTEEYTVMKKYKIAAILMIIHGGFMELGGIFAMIPALLIGTDKYDIGQYFEFKLPYFQDNLYMMMVMGAIYGVFRLIGAIGLLKNRMWGLVLSVINCVITITLMMFLLPAGIMDGILAGSALVLILIQYFGDKKIVGRIMAPRDFSARPSQILCKPPMWCRIEAPHRRFYI